MAIIDRIIMMGCHMAIILYEVMVGCHMAIIHDKVMMGCHMGVTMHAGSLHQTAVVAQLPSEPAQNVNVNVERNDNVRKSSLILMLLISIMFCCYVKPRMQ